MMKRLTLSALALSALGSLALAESHSQGQGAPESAALADMQETLVSSQEIIGGPLYSTNQNDMEDWDPETPRDDLAYDWAEVGEVTDILFSPEGEMLGIVAAIGGFLDLGDRHVMISLSDMRQINDERGSPAVMTRLTEEELEALPAVEGTWLPE